MVKLSNPDAPDPAVAALLREFAARYIWWKSSAEAVLFPRRVAAQVMDIGIFEDTQRLLDVAGGGYLRDVLAHAEPGNFRPRAWHYWHYRLGLADLDQVLALPVRCIAP